MRPDGKRHSHQRRIPLAALAEARRNLQGVARELRTCETVDELHDLVNGAIRGIYKIGELAVYDMTTRLGAQLGLAPEFVYLHAGTAKGARAPMPVRGRHKISRAELPPAFRRLRCYEAEDCLCIYKRDLARIGST